jgi:hypothetical protein
MKLLKISEGLASVNYDLSSNSEEKIRNEMVKFISFYAIFLNVGRRIIGKAIHIFHMYSV